MPIAIGLSAARSSHATELGRSLISARPRGSGWAIDALSTCTARLCAHQSMHAPNGLVLWALLVALACAARAQTTCSRTNGPSCPSGQLCSLQGVCTPRCIAALCEVWDDAAERCVVTCTGCSACAGGTCAPRPDLRNRCGACPGDVGYEACAGVAGAVAFDGPLVVDGQSILAILGNMTCDNRDAYARLPCKTDAHCATCDICSVRTCSGGACVAAPISAIGCGACARDADCQPTVCVDARCRQGTCIRRALPYCH